MEDNTQDIKFRRASRPKSRTGCQACKNRRIKCDETKPMCYRCQEYGSFCEYTPPQPRVAAPTARDRSKDLVPIQPRQSLQLISSPSDPFSCNEEEGRYFRLFHEKLAFDLSGSHEVSFWTRLIPQQSYREPAIKHAVLALSALYKSAISSETHTVNLDDEHVKFALVQQSQAISSLRQTLSDGQPQMRLALVASLLFSCFESFHGDWETATQQVYSGLKMLKRLCQGEKPSGVAEIDMEVALTFRRLELQILSFLAMNPMLEHDFNDLEVEEHVFDIPDQFTTFHGAFTAATNLAVSVLRHCRTSARYRDDPSSRELFLQQQQHLHALVDQWNTAYEPIFLELCQNPVGREYLGALHVQICMWKCEIMVATTMSETELVFDNFTAKFQRITYFARYVLQKDQEIRDPDSPRLQYGMGLIMALFYAATRCRDFTVRREAIDILREWPCTNGIWHSLQAAKVAEWIASIEEEYCVGLECIPEGCRVKMQSLKVFLQKGSIIVECMQPSVDIGVLKLRKANLQWP